VSYHTSYAFAAPADVVHTVVNDGDLLVGWLGEELTAGGRDDVTRYRIEPGPNPLELCWAPVPGPDAWAGRAVVRALPVGGSTIDIRLCVPVAFRTRIPDIDRIVSYLLRRIDAEAGRRHIASASVLQPVRLDRPNTAVVHEPVRSG
jgi:hypothetical protein